jgi:hypothetical protein
MYLGLYPWLFGTNYQEGLSAAWRGGQSLPAGGLDGTPGFHRSCQASNTRRPWQADWSKPEYDDCRLRAAFLVEGARSTLTYKIMPRWGAWENCLRLTATRRGNACAGITVRLNPWTPGFAGSTMRLIRFSMHGDRIRR